MIRRLLAAVLLLASACATTAPPVTSDPLPDPAPLRVRMTTNDGVFVIRLFPDVAPKTVEQFVRLVRAGVYDGIYFYRLDPGFVLQIANPDDRVTPLTPEQQALIHPLPLEPSPMLHQRGVISLAHYDDPNSGETSFSILLGDAPHLDQKYTIFGTLEKSEDVLLHIEATRDRKAMDVTGGRLRIVKMEVL